MFRHVLEEQPHNKRSRHPDSRRYWSLPAMSPRRGALWPIRGGRRSAGPVAGRHCAAAGGGSRRTGARRGQSRRHSAARWRRYREAMTRDPANPWFKLDYARLLPAPAIAAARAASSTRCSPRRILPAKRWRPRRSGMASTAIIVGPRNWRERSRRTTAIADFGTMSHQWIAEKRRAPGGICWRGPAGLPKRIASSTASSPVRPVISAWSASPPTPMSISAIRSSAVKRHARSAWRESRSRRTDSVCRRAVACRRGRRTGVGDARHRHAIGAAAARATSAGRRSASRTRDQAGGSGTPKAATMPVPMNGSRRNWRYREMQPCSPRWRAFMRAPGAMRMRSKSIPEFCGPIRRTWTRAARSSRRRHRGRRL